MFKYNGNEVKKVSYNGNECKKVIFNGTTVFESQSEHTYVVTAILNYFWGGTMQNSEDWDDDASVGFEVLSHATNSDIKIGLSFTFTRDGVPYTPTNDEFQLEYDLEVRVSNGSSAPNISSGRLYKDAFNGEPEELGTEYMKTWTVAKYTEVDSYFTTDTGTYWWFAFVSKSGYFIFKHKGQVIDNGYAYIRSSRDNWATYAWTPMKRQASKVLGTYTFKIVD